MSLGLVSRPYIRDFLSKSAHWKEGHGVTDSNIGIAMVYFAVVYATKPEVCVVLGSGGGLVPRIVAQAQRDSGVHGRIILVDGDCGRWGRPHKESYRFFQRHWPEIELWKMTTEEAATAFAVTERPIDYLHIDAGHSRAWEDFALYAGFIRIKSGFMTMHDTLTVCSVASCVERIKDLPNWEVINFEYGAGVALCRKVEDGLEVPEH